MGANAGGAPGRLARGGAELFRRNVIRAAAFVVVAFAAWLVAHARVAIFLTAVSLLIAVALDRIVRALTDRGAPRPVAIAGVLVAWAALVGGVVLMFIPPLSSQLGSLAQNAPHLVERIQDSDAFRYLARHLPPRSIASAARDRAAGVVSSALAIATGVLGGIAGLVTVYFVVAFMLASGRSLVAAWLAIPRQSTRWIETTERIYRALAGYVIGVLLIVAINATLTSTFLVIVGVPWFLPLGLLSGIASLVPYVGALGAGVILTLVAWASNGVWAAVATIAYYLVYQQVENHLIAPVVYRRAVNVNALVILLSALFLGEVFGFPGAVLAVPIAATAQIVARELLHLRRRSPGHRGGGEVGAARGRDVPATPHTSPAH